MVDSGIDLRTVGRVFQEKSLCSQMFAVARCDSVSETIVFLSVAAQFRGSSMQSPLIFEEQMMPTTNTASGLHKQAASDHQEAAKNHLKAAESHEKDDVSDAKANSKSAMGCCNTASKSSATACKNSAH
jgi:hypothetical protein